MISYCAGFPTALPSFTKLGRWDPAKKIPSWILGLSIYSGFFASCDSNTTASWWRSRPVCALSPNRWQWRVGDIAFGVWFRLCGWLWQWLNPLEAALLQVNCDLAFLGLHDPTAFPLCIGAGCTVGGQHVGQQGLKRLRWKQIHGQPF